MPLPPASFTVMVKGVDVAGVGAEIDDELAVTVTVEPTICTVTCPDTEPDLPIIVAVGLALSAPDVKVTVPGVVTVGALSMPVLVSIATTTPDISAFKEFNAFTEIVEVVEPSDLTEVGEAER